MNKGFYVRPTIFADVKPGMTIEREEIFGPVMCMIPFDTEAEAVKIANDTPYGLTNYVQSQDGARRNRLARQLRAGMVEMNGKFARGGRAVRRGQGQWPGAGRRRLGDRGVPGGQGDLGLGRRRRRTWPHCTSRAEADFFEEIGADPLQDPVASRRRF